MNKWKINVPDKGITDKLIKETGLSPFICRILASRGITSRSDAELFFNSSEFGDPLDILDMDKAVSTINEAVESGARITVYGDYDCDGVTSTYMLYSYLEALGAEVSWYIPTRDEGYGLNIPAVELLKKQGTELIITVDNGISAKEEAKKIYELGMELVITDHHQVPEELPRAEAVVNPHRPDDMSQYKHLAGCGVVLKLIMAMEGDTDSVLMQFADIAAIGTVGDIRAGYDCPELLAGGRRLARLKIEAAGVRYFWVKPSDVPIYVERGAADAGIAGKDILLEYEPEVYELLDLGIGRCRMCVAGPADFRDDGEHALRVATKFPHIAKTYYAAQGRDITIIKLNGSIEIAPLLGLSDVIVDIVETGKTLKENGLAPLETVAEISARFIANTASWQFRGEEIRTMCEKLGDIL